MHRIQRSCAILDYYYLCFRFWLKQCLHKLRFWHKHNTKLRSMARAAGSAPQVGVEDPDNLCGPPIYSWEGSGKSAWWFCRLCSAQATEGHLNSKKHIDRRKDYATSPSTWRFYLGKSNYSTPANQKPDSPPGTLEPQPALTDAPATGNRPDLLHAPPGLHDASQETIAEVGALRSEVAALRNTVATLSNEMETLRNEMNTLLGSVRALVNHAAAADDIKVVPHPHQ